MDGLLEEPKRVIKRCFVAAAANPRWIRNELVKISGIDRTGDIALTTTMTFQLFQELSLVKLVIQILRHKVVILKNPPGRVHPNDPTSATCLRRYQMVRRQMR